MEGVPLPPAPTVLEDPLVPQVVAKVANIDEVVDIWDDCHLYEHRLVTYRSSLPQHALAPLADPQSQEDDEHREVVEASKKMIDPTSSAAGGDHHQGLKPAQEDAGELLTIELYQHKTSFRALNTVGLIVWKSVRTTVCLHTCVRVRPWRTATDRSSVVSCVSLVDHVASQQSVALARYLEELWRQEGPSFLVGKRVIELGSGCGLTGILATLLGIQHSNTSDDTRHTTRTHTACLLTGTPRTGGHTTFTDMESVLLWTNRNVEHNLDPFKHTYRLKELHWCVDRALWPLFLRFFCSFSTRGVVGLRVGAERSWPPFSRGSTSSSAPTSSTRLRYCWPVACAVVWGIGR